MGGRGGTVHYCTMCEMLPPGSVTPTLLLLSVSGEWQWLSDSPSLLSPCHGAVSFYSLYGRDTTFTATAVGRPFRSLHAHHLQLLEWQGRPHKVFSFRGEDVKHYHLVLPSFFHLLETLHREGRHFAVILRTFGTDLSRILQAMSCALEGQHPQFPALRDVLVSAPRRASPEAEG